MKMFENLNESQKRWFAALKANEIGYGGISAVAKETGLSRTTITKGISELNSKSQLSDNRVRKQGGGRKPMIQNNQSLHEKLEEILSETTAGDPMSAIRWTCKSIRSITDILEKEGFIIGRTCLHEALIELGYSLQSNRKTLSKTDDPDRDRQFKIINRKVKRFLDENHPVISVDTKKKELIGKFSNSGKQWCPKGEPILVEDHDFPSRASGKAIPYGTYDIGKNQGFVNIGISVDTADFAVNSILRWWQEFGERNYPASDKILICADGGGSNGSRNRLCKYNLLIFSYKTGLEIYVCHYPPGTSKWNKIEHRMFSYISSNWRGCPLESYEAVIQLIGNTTTKTGLKIKAKLDKRKYRTEKKVSDEEFDSINPIKKRVLPKWNYSIQPL